MKKKIIIAIIVVTIVGGIGWGVKSKLSNSVQTGMPVEVAEVTSEKIVSKVSAEGMVKLDKTQSIAASNSADVVSVNVEVGDVVKAGDVLVSYDKDAFTTLKNELDDAKLTVKANQVSLEAAKIPPSEDELNQANNLVIQSEKNIEKIKWNVKQYENTVAQEKNNLDKAEKDYNSNLILFNSSAISKNELDGYKKDLDNAKTTYENAINQLKAENVSLESENGNLTAAKSAYDALVNKTNTEVVKNNIDEAQVRLEQAELKVKQIQADIDKFKMVETAPVDGTITAVNIAEGDHATEGTAIIEMSNIDNCIVSIDVPEYDMSGVKVGQKAIVTGDGFEGELEGVVSKISPMAHEKTSSGTTKQVVSTEIAVKDSSKLIVGFTVDADIITNTNPAAIVIPVMGYLTDEGGVDYVYIVKDDSTVERRDIKVVSYNNSKVEVSGVTAGEKIVNNPNAEILADGTLVSDTGVSE